LKALEEAVNKGAEGKLEVLDLQFADRDAVRKLKKKEMAEKIYKIAIKFDRSISDEELELIEEKLTNVIIRQQTPLRVLHRRADRIREKHIYKAKTKRLTPDSAEMRIHCQGGLYIKELITGDEGRTKPCVSEIINAKTEPLELDVLSIVKRR
jgi:tRNA pseudouridine synthase 10